MRSSRSYGDGPDPSSSRGDSCVEDDPQDYHDQDQPYEEESVSISDQNFDILTWYPAYQSCQRYFLDHAQYEPATQAVCALINIRLPFQRLDHSITSSHIPPSSPASSAGGLHQNFPPFSRPGGSSSSGERNNPGVFVSAIPYIRRLVVTNFDKPAVLHGFFGDDYVRGIMPHVQCERRNYLFAAKHGGWRTCKKQYDVGSGGGDGSGADETVPFMKPLDEVRAEEIAAAEKAWSDWLAMEDWMVGPNAPDRSNVRNSMGSGSAHESGRDPYRRG